MKYIPVKYFLLLLLFLIGVTNTFAQKQASKKVNPSKNAVPSPLATIPNPKYVTEKEMKNLLKDSDNDGVIDALDQEEDTQNGCPVDTRGVSLDSDGDGVKDYDDKEPYTPRGYPVDPNGVQTNIFICVDCSACGFKENFGSEPVYFEPNSSVLSGETQVKLRLIARFLIKNSRKCLAIEGYIGQYETLETSILSYNRAKAVADFLSHYYQISNERLKVKIKGRNDIVKIGNQKKESDRFNCRVEFTLTECSDKSDEKPDETLKKTSKKKK